MKYLILFFSLFYLIQNSVAQDGEHPLPYTYKESKYEMAPCFLGGLIALNKYISDSIRYPEPEKSKMLEGGVMLKFVVTKKGKIVNVEAINGTPGAPNFVKEAIRLVENMPLWIPATKKGKPVDAEYYLTIPFKLNIRKQ
jgi:protein TonB